MRLEIKNGFNPMHIILESQEEHVYMWHILNCPKYKTLKEYVEERNKALNSHLEIKTLEEFKFNLWKKLGG